MPPTTFTTRVTFDHVRNTAAGWTDADPTLGYGVTGMETDTGKIKIGDGETAWTDLGYAASDAAALDATTKANAAQAHAIQRANHTGTQAAATISDFAAAVAATPPASHSHGNITSAGAIGSTASLLPYTTASGVLSVSASMIASPSAGITLTEASANFKTTGSNARIGTEGAGSLIYTTGDGSHVRTTGLAAHIFTAGAGSHIETRHTFRMTNGTHVTTISHNPTDNRSIAFPDDDGTVALVESLATVATTGAASDVTNAVTTVTEITANTDDWAIGTGQFFRVSSDAARDVTSIAGGTSGRVVVLANVGDDPITLKHASGSGTAANRILVQWSGDFVLVAGASVSLWYDATSSRWKVH